jgi:hypothetical protein
MIQQTMVDQCEELIDKAKRDLEVIREQYHFAIAEQNEHNANTWEAKIIALSNIIKRGAERWLPHHGNVYHNK